MSNDKNHKRLIFFDTDSIEPVKKRPRFIRKDEKVDPHREMVDYSDLDEVPQIDPFPVKGVNDHLVQKKIAETRLNNFPSSSSLDNSISNDFQNEIKDILKTISDKNVKYNRQGIGHSNLTKIPYIEPLSDKVLNDLLLQPLLISKILTQENSGFELFLSKSIVVDDSKLNLLIRLLYLAVSCDSEENYAATLSLLLTSFRNSTFVSKLCEYTSNLKYSFEFDTAKEGLQHVTEIICKFMLLAPNEAPSKISLLLDVCDSVCHQLMKNNSDNANHDACVQLESNIQQIQHDLKFVKINMNENSGELQLQGSFLPRESLIKKLSFRNISVLPTNQDILQDNNPFLSKNIVKGPYESVDHYLDVHFRLLREDIIRPLREGMKQFRNNVRGKNSELFIYRNVYFSKSKLEDCGLVYYVALQLPKRFNAQRSKRLMFGNILCLSHNSFQTMIVATVQNRDELQQHCLGIKLESCQVPPEIFMDTRISFEMIESKAFFVPYVNTLKTLQKMETVPFENCIVKATDSTNPPNYLNIEAIYRLSTFTNTKFDVLSGLENWPSCDDLHLDESQRQALHDALTRQVAIIQGPPGTGKTYVGLEIARLLLLNQNFWKGKRKCPILVVSYTNHALDQFLEGISQFTEKIVRIGSRSKNENLSRFQINSHARSLGHRKYSEDLKQTKLYQLNIQKVSKLLNCIERVGIIKLNQFELYDLIPIQILNQLERENLTLSDFLLGNCKNENYEKNQKSKNIRHRKFRRFSERRHSNEINFDDVTDAREIIIRLSNKNKSIDVDQEIFNEEQNERMLDEKGDEVTTKEKKRSALNGLCEMLDGMSDEVTNTKGEDQNILNDLFEVLDTDYKELKMAAQKKEVSSFYESKLDILEWGLTVSGNQQECLNLEKIEDFLSLSKRQAWKLYNYWKNKLILEFLHSKNALEGECLKAHKQLEETKSAEHLEILCNMDVVGMTTTAAARYYNMLNELGPPIVIVEEAAEILESHVISSLSANCQHLILIGDHQQLKPKCNDFTLATKFHLNVSLFERLINNGIKYTRLENQHRMRPCISNLLVPTIYPELNDHESVLNYPRIRGMEEDIFFLDHAYLETKNDDENESVKNTFEAEFAIALCCYLLYQGYSNEDITILTPYSGQHRVLKEMQRKNSTCQNVRVSILDNFQGEESNIVILSLVRSNLKEMAGFMKCVNRTCVALSRAKHGFYMIGNMTMLAKVSPIWAQIQQKLIKNGNISTQMPLVCENHPYEIVRVSSAQDIISRRPNGACPRECGFLLDCGHNCRKSCHLDSNHERKCRIICETQLLCGHVHNIQCSDRRFYRCSTVVEREFPICKHTIEMKCSDSINDKTCNGSCNIPLNCGHLCGEKKCHAKTDPNHEIYTCLTIVERELPDCKHKIKMECSNSIKNAWCIVRCDAQLKCGHIHKTWCCRKETYKCPTIVKRELPDCKHTIEMKCSDSVNDATCDEKCYVRLDCGHQCKQNCHAKIDPNHENYECRVKCDRTPLNCQLNHACKKQCFEDCGQCSVPLNRKLPCGHTKPDAPCGKLSCDIKCLEKCTKLIHGCNHPCKKLCHKPCGGCKVKVEKIIPVCQHIIEMDCGVPVSSNVCTAHCSRSLMCGHSCQNRCNDPCTTHCLELVSSQYKCPRNHTIKLDCFTGSSPLNVLDDPEEEAYLWSQCIETCGIALDCGHLCKGKCGQCYNGRLHIQCKERCDKALVCGHVCKEPCSSICPPCQADCELKCRHSYCKKKCGYPCINCREKCNRRCKHSRCSKKCGDPCNIKSCMKPCPLKIRCGHSCIGFCGDPCPTLCRICDKEKVTAIFFGNEDDENARFIVLEDCGHIFEADGIDRWLGKTTNIVGIKKCPMCSKPIYNTKRFQKYISGSLRDIEKVKSKYFTEKRANNIKFDEHQHKKLVAEWETEVEDIQTKLGYLKPKRHALYKFASLSDMEVSLCSFRVEFLKKASDVKIELKTNQSCTKRLLINLITLVKMIGNLSHSVPDQMRDEAVCELQRISVQASINVLKSKIKNESNALSQLLKSINEAMDPNKKFFRETEKVVVNYLKDAAKLVPLFHISDADRIMIVKAMGFKQGHWYKCPQGHIYAIGECGGATEESTCPDCKAKIGGLQHRLQRDNHLASEMDGATRSAWPGV